MARRSSMEGKGVDSIESEKDTPFHLVEPLKAAPCLETVVGFLQTGVCVGVKFMLFSTPVKDTKIQNERSGTERTVETTLTGSLSNIA